MTVEAALREAQRYETRIRELYAEAARSTPEADAKRFYRLMEEDEASHLRYLERKLVEWKKAGRISYEVLGSSVPDPALVEAAVAKVASPLKDYAIGGENEALARALKAEEETSAFYQSLLCQFEGEALRLFSRFLEIETGHTRMVRAELDLRSRTGHWFEFKEFDLEE